MSQVNTVLGPVDSKDLGFTLMHEHVMVVNHVMRSTFSEWINQDNIIKQAVEDVLMAKKLGVQTIVDATPINLGRDVSIIKEVSKQTGVHFIVSTGFYWTEEPWMLFWDPEAIAARVVQEVEKGIEGGDVKPNIIKAATEFNGVTLLNFKVLQIAGHLHLRTGLPITTHSAARQEVGLMQLDVFESMGVDLSRVIIGHCGDTTDINYLEKILKQGSYIGVDRFGLEDLLSSKLRIDTLVELCRLGYEKQIVLSHDYCSFIDWAPSRFLEEANPLWHYKYLPQTIIPELRKRGVSDQKIQMMTIENPRRIFESASA